MIEKREDKTLQPTRRNNIQRENEEEKCMKRNHHQDTTTTTSGINKIGREKKEHQLAGMLVVVTLLKENFLEDIMS
jgi:hypothetical protein